MLTRRYILTAVALTAALMVSPAVAQTKLKVVATISILGDLTKNVGGDRVDVVTLVGPAPTRMSTHPRPATLTN
jgi:zinc/manganese transport system substrate-binding protein